MNSPYTGSPMQLIHEERVLKFRKEDFTIIKHFFYCADSNAEFETEEQLNLNLSQVYNQYRVKHRLPFPEEITRIREQYELSSAKMSEVLGFGANTYRLYEQGEIPSLSNARLIQLAEDPIEFEKLVNLCDQLPEKDKTKIRKRIKTLVFIKDESVFEGLANYLFGKDLLPSIYRGYRKPSTARFNHMLSFLVREIQPYKVKMCKLLFYADFSHFKKTGRSISGTSYIAINMGPVPNNFDGLFNEARREGFLQIAYKDFPNGGIGEQFFPGIKGTDENIFSELEMTTLQEVVLRFKKTGTDEMISMSHEEDAWKKTQANNELISYRFAFELKYM